MSDPVVKQRFPLGPQWPTIDPFLFVAHHLDHYPKALPDLGPDAPLDGRDIGQDFGGKDGWNMYHGAQVPGFPQHPHRGFETITYVRQGIIDHADSMGATARFGKGDTQWLTAGAGIQHAEMFPLIDQNADNPLELFQIWLNLPASDKMADPYFTMLWDDETPTFTETDEQGNATEITVITGSLNDRTGPRTPPNSWAARAEAEVGVFHLTLEAGASFTLPASQHGETMRVLYAFEGSTLDIAGEALEAHNGALIDAGQDLALTASVEGPVECMILQGRPIAEPVARYGPFVMNTEAEIQQAFTDYRTTQFGGWPWDSPEPNHGATARRFAIHADGRREDATENQPIS